MRIFVVTDDFTSAADGSVAFAARGIRTAVRMRPGADFYNGATVVAVDTDSRNLPAALAAGRVAEAAKDVKGSDIVVKQFDSTLRGNLVAECMALLAATGRSKLLVVAAFPHAGRTTRDGVQLLHGIPVSETAFGSDPLNPVRQSAIPALFAAQGIKATLAREPGYIPELLAESAIVVADAATESDMDRLAGLALGLRDAVIAGSTGIVRALARRLPQQDRAKDGDVRCRKVLVLVGSKNPQSRAQRDRLVADGVPGFQFVPDAQAVPAVVAQARTALETHDAVCVSVADGEYDPLDTTRHVAAVGAALINHGAVDGLVVTGGETAKHIALHIGADQLRLLREVEPGVPQGVFVLHDRVLPIVAKAGGFGTEAIFVHALRALMGRPS